jgi:hypothetical protein
LKIKFLIETNFFIYICIPHKARNPTKINDMKMKNLLFVMVTSCLLNLNCNLINAQTTALSKPSSVAALTALFSISEPSNNS